MTKNSFVAEVIFKVKTGISPELMKDIFEFADVPLYLLIRGICPSIYIAYHPKL